MTTQHPAELTLRAVILGGLITLVFTAANVYLGLKAGLTFATSLPAAVISMAVLRLLPRSSILENNIVQTIASAAGTLSAIIFVLPGLVMVGWWQDFPYWTTACVCAFGGVLGVMFSVPLRRALVTGSSLPYPEGTAAAEVLVVGCADDKGSADNRRGLRLLLVNSIVSAGYALLVAMKLATAEVAHFFRVGSGVSGVAGGLSFALLGVGHLVGLSVGMAMLLGVALSWIGLMPYFTAGIEGEIEALANSVFRNNVRFVGAGTIGVAAVWSLLKILGPIIAGIRASFASSAQRARGEALALSERDLPFNIVVGTIVLMLVPIGALLWMFLSDTVLAPSAGMLVAASLVFLLLVGLVIASVCGYMAGLIGASNSPISGVGILAVLGASLMLVLLMGRDGSDSEIQALIAYALFTTAVVFGIATISNDNLQDLKTGQLVGATPWRQQVALVIGVGFGAIVIPPVLTLLNAAFGFTGSADAGPDALAAPQAALISALAEGVLGGELDWNLLGIGAAFGIVAIVIDSLLDKAGKLRLPPLCVGIGMYLPMALTIPIVIGAVLGHRYDQWAARQANPDKAVRMGTLMATGMIVGESLFGVLFAGLVAMTGSDSPLGVVGSGFATVALWGGFAVFVAVLYRMYRDAGRASTLP